MMFKSDNDLKQESQTQFLEKTFDIQKHMMTQYNLKISNTDYITHRIRIL